MCTEYDVMHDPFVFRAQTDRGQLSVVEVDGTVHIAVHDMAVFLPSTLFHNLAIEWCKLYLLGKSADELSKAIAEFSGFVEEVSDHFEEHKQTGKPTDLSDLKRRLGLVK